MKKFNTLLLFWAITLTTTAQPIDIGLSFGAFTYNGDLSPASPIDMIQQMRPSIGVFGRTSFSQKTSARLAINFGSVAADDSRGPYPERQLNFRTNITELTLTGEWHALRIRHTESSFTMPYLFAGIGVYNFNPKAELDNGDLVRLQPLGTEGQGLAGYDSKYSLIQLNIPVGAGIRFILSDRWTICLEVSGRVLQTDYLDDVSATRVNYQDVFEGNGPLAAQLSNPGLNSAEPISVEYRRGSPFKDWYYQGAMLISYNFGEAIRKAFRDPVPCYSKW